MPGIHDHCDSHCVNSSHCIFTELSHDEIEEKSVLVGKMSNSSTEFSLNIHVSTFRVQLFREFHYPCVYRGNVAGCWDSTWRRWSPERNVPYIRAPRDRVRLSFVLLFAGESTQHESRATPRENQERPSRRRRVR